jgi:hypothetical protein
MPKKEVVKFTDILHGGRVHLNFYPNAHRYTAEVDGAKAINVASSTGITGTLDKSRFLIPWASRTSTAKAKDTIVDPTIAIMKQKLTPAKKIKALLALWDEVNMGKLLQAVQDAPDEVRDEAADVGSIAHDWLQQYMLDRNPDRPLNALANNAIDAGLKWMDKHHVEFMGIERRVYSLILGVAGTTDFFGLIDGELSILDWKSGNGIYDEAFLQTALYQGAIEEEDGVKIANRWIVRIDKNTGEMYERKETRETVEADLTAFMHLKGAYEWKKVKTAEYYARKNTEVKAAAAGN